MKLIISEFLLHSCSPFPNSFTPFPHSCASRNLPNLHEIPDQVRDEEQERQDIPDQVRDEEQFWFQARSTMSKTLSLLIFMAFFCNLFALGEVRTCTFSSALPSTGVRFLYCSAFMGSGVQNIPGLEQTKIVKDVYGGSFSLMLDPRWEASAWITSHEHSTSIELQAKFLWLKMDNKYLSLAFSAYNSEGKNSSSRSEYTDKCKVNGFAVPLIFSVDTRRNLLMNVSAGLNCDWVTASGEYKQYNNTTHQYDWVTYGYDPLAALRWHLNFSLEAFGGGFSMIPEIGISFADAGDQGMQRFFNYGFTLGGRF